MKKIDECVIAVAGTGYVGLSMATLLSQKHKVYAVDIVPEKVDMINRRISPIADKEIEEFFATKEPLMHKALTVKQILLLSRHPQTMTANRIILTLLPLKR